MFKKQPSSIKTSAPLRASDRRKLKQRVLEAYSTDPELGDLLVPDGIMSQRMKTYTDHPGVVYLSPEGDPLWFTIGRDSDTLIPTVYTLWKKYDLLPRVITPASVIPILIGGADLMIPGVIQVSTTSVSPQRLVSVAQHTSGSSTCGPPLAVGRLAVDFDTLRMGCKGKAVTVLHTWKDHLFNMGIKCDPPGEMELKEDDEGDVDAPKLEPAVADDSQASNSDDVNESSGKHGAADESLAPLSAPVSAPSGLAFSKEEVSEILRVAVLQVISTTLDSLTSAYFPLPASTFYSSYILPFRPAFVGKSLSDEQAQSSSNEASSPYPLIDIKHSGYKSLLAFFKLLDKQQILTLKDTKPEPLVLNVSTRHPDVLAHRPYTSLRDKQIKKVKRERREEEERKKVQEMEVKEIWKPHAASGSAEFFTAGGFDSSALYSYSDLRTTVNQYVAARQLTNLRDKTHVCVGTDKVLFSAVCGKTETSESIKFLKREDIVKRLSKKMQNWYEMRAAGKEPVLKMGQLKPISVVVKVRQGRKAKTLVRGFGPFFLEAQEIADELRRLCASAAFVSFAGHGKAPGMEVQVQGKQIKTVTKFLQSRGVPKKWIESTDLTKKKKIRADCEAKPTTTRGLCA